MDLQHLLFGDGSSALGRVIAYRPVLNTLTGNANATLFLMQCCYRWFSSGQRPFYKFNAPCDHALCRPGDSWQEELGLGRTAFENARAAVATKVTRGTSKQTARQTAMILYWTDSERRTWYEVNESLLWQMLVAALKLDEASTVSSHTAVDNAVGADTSVHYLESSQPRRTLSSEKTTKRELAISKFSCYARSPKQVLEVAAVLQTPNKEVDDRKSAGSLSPWWQAALRELRGQMTRATYERLLLGSQARFTGAGTLVVAVRDRSAAIHLERLTARVRAAVETVIDQSLSQVVFDVLDC